MFVLRTSGWQATISLSTSSPDRNAVTSASNRCVTFDLWETLIFDDPEQDEVRGRKRCDGLQAALADQGVILGTEDLKRGYEESAPKLQAVWNRNDEVPIIEQIRLIVNLAAGHEIKLDPSRDDSLEDAYVDPILSIPPKMNPDAPNTLHAVKERGYKIGLISNTGRSPGAALRRLLDDYGILGYFDATIFSNEIRLRKPDRAIFDSAAHMLGAKNESIVHVGDSPEADFWGARNAGMQAILLDQTPPKSSQWPPHSLFALARSNTRQNPLTIEACCRIEALTKTLEVIDYLFQ